MNKKKFLEELQKGLNGLPLKDIEERLNFYNEMIEDRIEEGLSEEEAVSTLGNLEEMITQIVAETPISKIAKERIKSKRRLSALEIVLLVLGSPIWVSLLIALIAVILSVYVSLWSVVISLWAAFVSLLASAFGSIAAGIIFAFINKTLTGVALICAGFVLLGLSIFMFFGTKVATKGILLITKKFALWIKNCIIKKEAE